MSLCRILGLAAILGCAVSAASPAEIPAGTEIQIRLRTAVSSADAKPGDIVEAFLIAPIVADGQFLVSAGSSIRGTVRGANPSPDPDSRATLRLDFQELFDVAGNKTLLVTKILDVDNAREGVDEDGRIVGILASETISARLDQGLGRLSERFGNLGGILQTAKGAVLEEADREITCPPGVEMTLVVTETASLKGEFWPPSFDVLSPQEELYALVNAQPFQTMAEKPEKPSDLTNLMFLGPQESVQAVFEEAGWATAAELNAQSGLETFRAIAEQRGYEEAPVSVLLLDGKPPDLVFQKQYNTFAERHHLRIWKRPNTFQGQPVWVSAATHDTGIEFSPENRTFIHTINGKIDGERAKVVSDLVLTGRVRALAFVSRPDVPKESSNATGDKLETDGNIAVLLCE